MASEGLRQRLPWGPLVAAALIVALACPAAAPAGKRQKPPPAEFFGIQSFEHLSAGELEALRKARVGTHRAIFRWGVVEQSPGERNWVQTDYDVGAAALYGIQVMAVLFGTPPHVSHNSAPPVSSPEAIAAWRAFAADAARRYGPGGEFWRLNPDLPYRPITRWQVWNEPSSNGFWGGAPPNVRQYANLVRETSGAVKGVIPGAQILLAGILAHRGADPGGVSMKRYLRGLYRVRGIERFFDGLALHPYTIRPRRVMELTEKLRELTMRFGDRKAPIWITEMGWSTGGSGEGSLVTDMAGQARRLAKSYRMLLSARRELGLQGIVWHVMRDFHWPGWDYWVLRMGLFNAKKEAKPAWQALARITRGRAGPIVEPPSQPPPPPPEPEPCFLLIFC